MSTATDESTSAAGPVNLTTDSTFSINTGATRDVLFLGVVDTYNTAAPAVHTITVEVDGVDYSYAFLAAVTNQVYPVPIFIPVSAVTTGAKTVRYQYGTNAGTAHFLNRKLTALLLT
jgi:hypothetical protein